MVKIDLLKDGKVERTSFPSNITRAIKEKDYLLSHLTYPLRNKYDWQVRFTRSNGEETFYKRTKK